MSRPSPASRASMVNSTGRLAGMPEALRPGPLARTLLASWAGSTLILKGLEGQKGWTVCWGSGKSSSHTRKEGGFSGGREGGTDHIPSFVGRLLEDAQDGP